MAATQTPNVHQDLVTQKRFRDFQTFMYNKSVCVCICRYSSCSFHQIKQKNCHNSSFCDLTGQVRYPKEFKCIVLVLHPSLEGFPA